MKTMITKIRWGLGLIVVGGTLAFGVQEAKAGSRAHAFTVCENYPQCSSQTECFDCCVFLGHDDGFCTMAGACLCS